MLTFNFTAVLHSLHAVQNRVSSKRVFFSAGFCWLLQGHYQREHHSSQALVSVVVGLTVYTFSLLLSSWLKALCILVGDTFV